MNKFEEVWKKASNYLGKQEVIIYGVYHNYESDYKGDYSFSIAIEENNRDSEFDLEIPKDIRYESFDVDTSVELGSVKTWEKIWKLEEEGALKRAYTFDFEKYYPNGVIEIHIAIKEK